MSAGHYLCPSLSPLSKQPLNLPKWSFNSSICLEIPTRLPLAIGN